MGTKAVAPYLNRVCSDSTPTRNLDLATLTNTSGKKKVSHDSRHLATLKEINDKRLQGFYPTIKIHAAKELKNENTILRLKRNSDIIVRKNIDKTNINKKKLVPLS
jgi:hypothetical protein